MRRWILRQGHSTLYPINWCQILYREIKRNLYKFPKKYTLNLKLQLQLVNQFFALELLPVLVDTHCCCCCFFANSWRLNNDVTTSVSSGNSWVHTPRLSLSCQCGAQLRVYQKHLSHLAKVSQCYLSSSNIPNCTTNTTTSAV